MHEEFQHLDLFEQYLSGTQDRMEKLAFENRLKTDTGFANEFSLFKNILAGARAAELDVLKATIKEVEGQLETSGFFLDEESIVRGIKEAELETLRASISSVQNKMEKEGLFDEPGLSDHTESRKQQPARMVTMWRRYRSIAAVLLVGAIGLIWLLNTGTDYGQTYNKYYAVDEQRFQGLYESVGFDGAADSDGERKNSLFEGLDLYKRKAYGQAVVALEKHHARYRQDVSALFYAGLAYMESEQYEKAGLRFKEVIDSKDDEWQKDAEWYLALTYLQIKKYRKQAKDLFQKISEDENAPNREQAKAIRSEL